MKFKFPAMFCSPYPYSFVNIAKTTSLENAGIKLGLARLGPNKTLFFNKTYNCNF